MLEKHGEDGQDYTRVDSIDELRELLSDKTELFVMCLEGNATSEKDIMLLPDERFSIFNYIDSSRIVLSAEELDDESQTLIGKAIKAGAFWMVGFPATANRRPYEWAKRKISEYLSTCKPEGEYAVAMERGIQALAECLDMGMTGEGY